MSRTVLSEAAGVRNLRIDSVCCAVHRRRRSAAEVVKIQSLIK